MKCTNHICISYIAIEIDFFSEGVKQKAWRHRKNLSTFEVNVLCDMNLNSRSFINTYIYR